MTKDTCCHKRFDQAVLNRKYLSLFLAFKGGLRQDARLNLPHQRPLMPLLKLDNLSLAYGQQVLFDSIQLLLNKGDRLCLVGRNGVGKSTLLKVIEGLVESDGGSRWLDTAVKVAGLSQDLPEANDERVLDYVASGLAQLGQDLAQYQRCIEAPDADLNLLAQLQSRIEAADGWSLQNRIEQVL
ncbi:MAG TPA: ATP-binding cassette domain-containing protein, partial [Marinagarivorans sp.]|nr:ATP-binding cassette domain-containing protein [Marinagarivorans sp.]